MFTSEHMGCAHAYRNSTTMHYYDFLICSLANTKLNINYYINILFEPYEGGVDVSNDKYDIDKFIYLTADNINLAFHYYDVRGENEHPFQ